MACAMTQFRLQMFLLSILYVTYGTPDVIRSINNDEKPTIIEGNPGAMEEDNCYNNIPCLGTTVHLTTEGTICFPSIGNYYGNNLDCTWRVSAPIGSVVRLDFTEMDTEECSSCSCDYVSVHDGPDASGNQLAKLCGSEHGTLYYSHYQDLFIHFFSDHTFNAKGFNVDVSFIPTPRIAFYASRITSLDAISESVKVIFHDVTVNDGDSFDIETSDFTCKVAGPYFFSISAGAQARKEVQLILRKNRIPYVSVIRSTAEPTAIDMMSRSVIMELEVGDIVDVLLFRYTSIHSDDDMQTSFSGFHLPFVNEHEAAIFVARPDNITLSEMSYIPGFEKRIVDIGGWGNDTENMYMYKPHDGIYYQELSSGLAEENYVYLYANALYSVLSSSAFGSEGYTTLSLSHMSNSSAGDYLRMRAGARSGSVAILHTNTDLQISISSFILATEDHLRPHFRAYRNSSTSTIGNIPFTIEISHGISFNETAGTFTCVVPGVYFVHVSCGTYYTTSVSYVAVIGIKKNGQDLARLTRFITDELHISHLSRNIIVDLDAGDELYLTLDEGWIFSGSNRDTTFSALLLYEDEDYLKAIQKGNNPNLKNPHIQYMTKQIIPLINDTLPYP